MDYKEALNYLHHLQFVARKLDYLTSTWADMFEELKRAETNLKNIREEFVGGMFDGELYDYRLNKSKMEVKRLEAIKKIFEANPNKTEDVQLRSIINKAISKAMQHLSKEEIDEMNHNDLLGPCFKDSDKDIDISAVPEYIYFEENEQAKIDTAIKFNEPLTKQASSAKKMDDELVK